MIPLLFFLLSIYVQLLLQHGAEIDAQDIRRFTPLMMASLEGQADVLKIMLGARSDFIYFCR